LDMNLPGVSGHYVFRHLRSQPQLIHIPVIVATANSLLAAAIEKELGSGDHLLIKPVSLMELQKLVKRLCPVR
ncbi:MAG: two-component system response regulator, partial [Aggregatilineales bacterium]